MWCEANEMQRAEGRGAEDEKKAEGVQSEGERPTVYSTRE